MQQPRSLTRFLCWSLAIKITSFLNSVNPCRELFESLFTAISCPSINVPWESLFTEVRISHSRWSLSFEARCYIPYIPVQNHLVPTCCCLKSYPLLSLWWPNETMATPCLPLFLNSRRLISCQQWSNKCFILLSMTNIKFYHAYYIYQQGPCSGIRRIVQSTLPCFLCFFLHI